HSTAFFRALAGRVAAASLAMPQGGHAGAGGVAGCLCVRPSASLTWNGSCRRDGAKAPLDGAVFRTYGPRRRLRCRMEAMPALPAWPVASACVRRRRSPGTDRVDVTELRPAFYALRSGGWRDYVTVLHLPYTAWNLSYVALGAALAPRFHTDRMLWTMAAFALALGVAAHALDEHHGRPLRTQIPGVVLVGLGIASLAGACAIGAWAAFAWVEPWLLAFVAA